MIFTKLIKNEIDVLNYVEEILKCGNPLLNIKLQETIIRNSVANFQHPASNCMITYLNQHCFNIYNSNPEYKNLLDNKFVVFQDGIGIFLILKILGHKKLKRFNATDVNQKIFNLFSYHQSRMFLIGGKFKKEFIFEITAREKLNVVGYCDGYFEEQQFQKIIEEVKFCKPEVIIIAMGVPKQEILACKLSSLLNVKLILCVGGFLEFCSGSKKRAPIVLRKAGFEWLYRLLTEPGRLWKRYLIGIPLFIFNIFKHLKKN